MTCDIVRFRSMRNAIIGILHQQTEPEGGNRFTGYTYTLRGVFGNDIEF